jgi:hypothetical protein
MMTSSGLLIFMLFMKCVEVAEDESQIHVVTSIKRRAIKNKQFHYFNTVYFRKSQGTK